MPDDSKKRLLEYALGRLGRKQLAARLKVPEEIVARWLEGSAAGMLYALVGVGLTRWQKLSSPPA